MVRHSYLWWPWVQRHLDDRGWTNADLDRATDAIGQRVDQSVIGRWKNHRTEPLISSVRAVAKVFNEDVREAVIRAGLLTPAELELAWPEPDDIDLSDLSDLPDDEILDELRRRLRSRTRKSPTAGKPSRRRQPTSNGNTPTSSTTLDASVGADSTTVALPAPAQNGTPAPSSPPVEDEDGAGANAAQRDS